MIERSKTTKFLFKFFSTKMEGKSFKAVYKDLTGLNYSKDEEMQIMKK